MAFLNIGGQTKFHWVTSGQVHGTHLAIVIVHSDFLEHVGPVLQSVPELPISGVSPVVQLCGEAYLGDGELMESILSHEGAHGDIRSLLKGGE